MSDEVLRAMLFVGACFTAIFAMRAMYVMALYKSWSLDELLGFSDDGWETESMKEKRRDFWQR